MAEIGGNLTLCPIKTSYIFYFVRITDAMVMANNQLIYIGTDGIKRYSLKLSSTGHNKHGTFTMGVRKRVRRNLEGREKL